MKEVSWRTGWDSNPREGCPSTPLAGERLQPLGHLSIYPCIMRFISNQGVFTNDRTLLFKRFKMNSQIKSNLRSIFIILTYSIIILLFDQVTKIYVVHIFDLSNKLSRVVIPGFFNLKMAWNEGINFGLFASGSDSIRIILIAISIIICSLLFLWSIRQKNHSVHLFSAAIIGGAFGNVLDRIVYGAVADFLNFTCCGIQNPYSFNVADISIFLGATGLIFYPNSFESEKDSSS